MLEHFRRLAAYNRWANGRLLEDLAGLDRAALHAGEPGVNFGSILGILNHLLLGDRLWLSRFLGGAAPNFHERMPYPEFADFKAVREAEDARIADFAAGLDPARLGEVLEYTTTGGVHIAAPMAVCVFHFFNHQTHHRGQVHALMGRHGVEARDIDLIYFVQE
ncbi:MAG: DinB family protein [Desulfovibrionaceae bacterium]|jgi:uncharacterized damage-inducible protein DinB|nr:DinB family protein [Desulfovibrionaceae bacterium]